MSRFLDFLDARQIDWREGRPVWWTLAPLRYRSRRLGVTVFIPAETVTDLASVPRLPFAWWVAGGRGTRAAVVHDFACQFKRWLTVEGVPAYAPRALADEIFLEALLADPISGVNAVTARLMYAAVRAAGMVTNHDPERTAALNPEWSAEGLPRETATVATRREPLAERIRRLRDDAQRQGP